MVVSLGREGQFLVPTSVGRELKTSLKYRFRWQYFGRRRRYFKAVVIIMVTGLLEKCVEVEEPTENAMCSVVQQGERVT